LLLRTKLEDPRAVVQIGKMFRGLKLKNKRFLNYNIYQFLFFEGAKPQIYLRHCLRASTYTIMCVEFLKNSPFAIVIIHDDILSVSDSFAVSSNTKCQNRRRDSMTYSITYSVNVDVDTFVDCTRIIKSKNE